MPTAIVPITESMTTREIAELTGKEHKHVRRDAQAMFAELKIDESSFGRIYLDSMNREQAEYSLDKELTITLTSGYSTKQRNIIIKRWLELEAVPQLPPELAAIQALVMQQHAINTKVDKVQADMANVTKRLHGMSSDTGYTTITGYLRKKGVRMPIQMANSMGRTAARRCREEGLNIGSVPDERFGSANSYPVWIVDGVYGADM